VGCNNPKVKHNFTNVRVMERLTADNVLVVHTGYAMIAAGKAGLMMLESAGKANDGLKALCQARGIPPVLHMESCVDCSRILDIRCSDKRQIVVPPTMLEPRNP